MRGRERDVGRERVVKNTAPEFSTYFLPSADLGRNSGDNHIAQLE